MARGDRVSDYVASLRSYCGRGLPGPPRRRGTPAPDPSPRPGRTTTVRRPVLRPGAGRTDRILHHRAPDRRSPPRRLARPSRRHRRSGVGADRLDSPSRAHPPPGATRAADPDDHQPQRGNLAQPRRRLLDRGRRPRLLDCPNGGTAGLPAADLAGRPAPLPERRLGQRLATQVLRPGRPRPDLVLILRLDDRHLVARDRDAAKRRELLVPHPLRQRQEMRQLHHRFPRPGPRLGPRQRRHGRRRADPGNNVPPPARAPAPGSATPSASRFTGRSWPPPPSGRVYRVDRGH